MTPDFKRAAALGRLRAALRDASEAAKGLALRLSYRFEPDMLPEAETALALVLDALDAARAAYDAATEAVRPRSGDGPARAGPGAPDYAK